MTESITFNPREPDKETYLRLREMDRASGWLGMVFGDSTNAPINIAGLVVGLVVIAALIMTVWPGGNAAAEGWKVMTPIITMVLGFMFGKRSN